LVALASVLPDFPKVKLEVAGMGVLRFLLAIFLHLQSL
jgi:hypothetical protein